MSAEDIAALVAAVSNDPGIAQRFAATPDAAAAVALAGELGYQVTAAELTAAAAQAAGSEVSDEELADAQGGTAYFPPTFGCTGKLTYC